MKNRIISLLLILIMIFSLVACGEYNPPADGNGDGDDKTPGTEDQTPPDDGGDKVGIPFKATVMLNGKPYTPPEVSDDSLAVKVRWTDGEYCFYCGKKA